MEMETLFGRVESRPNKLIKTIHTDGPGARVVQLVFYVFSLFSFAICSVFPISELHQFVRIVDVSRMVRQAGSPLGAMPLESPSVFIYCKRTSFFSERCSKQFAMRS